MFTLQEKLVFISLLIGPLFELYRSFKTDRFWKHKSKLRNVLAFLMLLSFVILSRLTLFIVINMRWLALHAYFILDIIENMADTSSALGGVTVLFSFIYWTWIVKMFKKGHYRQDAPIVQYVSSLFLEFVFLIGFAEVFNLIVGVLLSQI